MNAIQQLRETVDLPASYCAEIPEAERKRLLHGSLLEYRLRNKFLGLKSAEKPAEKVRRRSNCNGVLDHRGGPDIWGKIMTQLEALKELAERVEAGDDDVKSHLLALSRFIGGTAKKNGQILAAYSGSLDAAHSLHKAVLGDRWTAVEIRSRANMTQWVVVISKMVEDQEVAGFEYSTTPARAWLLAIIKAKISELGGVL